MRWAKDLWRFIAAPSRRIEALTKSNEMLSLGLRNATDKAATLQEKLNDSNERPCQACVVLQQLVNHMTLAAGSRIKPFDGYGPTLVVPEEKPMEPVHPRHGRQAVQHHNKEFVEQLEKTLREAIKPEVPQ